MVSGSPTTTPLATTSHATHTTVSFPRSLSPMLSRRCHHNNHHEQRLQPHSVNTPACRALHQLCHSSTRHTTAPRTLSRRRGSSSNNATPPNTSNTSVYPAASGGVLQLGQFVQPNDLATAWQDDILPGCLSTWQALSEQLAAADSSSQAPARCGVSQGVDVQLIEHVLLQLDALLGTCQQVLLVCGLLKDRHSSQQWRAAAAAVFVEARSLEQAVCSDVQLQQGLLACVQQLEHSIETSTQQRQQQAQTGSAEGTDSSTPALTSANTSTWSAAQLHLLARSLLRHMQLESLTPCSMAALPTAGQQHRHQADAQVLTLQEQQAILSGLLAEQKVLVNRLQALVFDPAAAPVVELDADNAQVVLGPLQQQGLLPLLPLQGNSAQQAAAAGTAGAVSGGSTGGSSAVVQELRLDLQTVTRLLRMHTDADVRAEVYSAGLLCRLDGVLSVWAELAEVRRKIGRTHGCNSYADFILQHSLLGGPEAAGSFCQELAAALQPHAQDALQQLQPHRQPPLPSQQPPDVSGCDLPRMVFQEWQAHLSADDLLQLQDYLQLPTVLAGLSHVLQLLLGLTLTQRPPHPGEVWADGVLVLELRECRTPANNAAGSVTATSSSDAAEEAGGRVLGTVYLDLNSGYAAQLLLYARDYTCLASSTRQQSQDSAPAEEAAALRDSNSWQAGLQGSSPAVALGLQSSGVLAGSYDQVALGLWEVCHEMGHAVNFILSSNSSSDSVGDTGGSAACAAAAAGSSSHGSSRQPFEAAQHDTGVPSASLSYHLHASWLPIELLELPSTLFEVLALDPHTLQLLCRHQTTNEPLHEALAARLARFMQATRYHPALYQSVVLAMLFDLELASISSRQLGQHAAHHLWRCLTQELSAMPGVELTLQQVSTMPRLLSTGGQGYGYAVAWSLAQLIQPQLVQHIQQPAGSAGADGVTQSGNSSSEHKPADARQQWRQLLGAGVELADPVALASMLAALLRHDVSSQQLVDMLQKHATNSGSGTAHSSQLLLAELLQASLEAVAVRRRW